MSVIAVCMCVCVLTHSASLTFPSNFTSDVAHSDVITVALSQVAAECPYQSAAMIHVVVFMFIPHSRVSVSGQLQHSQPGQRYSVG